MDNTYLDLAFADLGLINEEVPFEVKTGNSKDSVWDDLLDFEDEEENKEPEIAVSDEEAETEEEVKEPTGYLGKVVLSCVNCGENIFKDEDEVVEDEDEELCCVGEPCSNCSSERGFKKIGKVVPLDEITEEETDEIEDEPFEDEEEEIKEERFNGPMREARRTPVRRTTLSESRQRAIRRRRLQERALRKNKFTIKKIGERELDESRVNRRISPSRVRELQEKRARTRLTPPVAHPASKAVKCENFNEKSFDNLVEQLVNKNYKNIKSYKTTDIKRDGKTLKIEGLITFKSGNAKKTRFVFESVKNDSVGKFNVRYLGTNKDFTDKPNAMVLRGKIGRNTLTCESIKYDFPIKSKALKESKEQKNVKGLITLK